MTAQAPRKKSKAASYRQQNPALWHAFYRWMGDPTNPRFLEDMADLMTSHEIAAHMRKLKDQQPAQPLPIIEEDDL